VSKKRRMPIIAAMEFSFSSRPRSIWRCLHRAARSARPFMPCRRSSFSPARSTSR
jgi:hypothetical protein